MTRSKCLRYVSMSHISHYRVLPLAMGPLTSLESIAEVPNSSLGVFKWQGCFCSFAYWLRQNIVLRLFVTLVCHSLLTERQKKRSIVTCVSPLTSLMLDQKAKFVSRELPAHFVGEARCKPQAVESVHEGKAQLLFTSPVSCLIVCTVISNTWG